jgi:hypothetical protein
MSGPTYLTFDVDWAQDYVVRHAMEKVLSRGFRATFFWTHKSTLVAEMIAHPNLEVGLHPNFMPLLRGAASEQDSFQDVLGNITPLNPEGVSVRAHSLVSATPILDAYARAGLRVDSSCYCPVLAGGSWQLHTGLTVAPFNWSDYIDVLKRGRSEPPAPGRIVAFHPIHIYLNISDLKQYAHFKTSGLAPADYKKAFPSGRPGVSNIFERTLDAIRKSGAKTGFMSDFSRDR